MKKLINDMQSLLNFDDVPVGALIVNDLGEIISFATNERILFNDPSAHAEIVAIRDAGKKIANWRLDDLTLVVTLEPCTMCAGAIIQSRLKRVVFGAFNPKEGAIGSIYDVIREKRAPIQVEVVGGILAEDCLLLLNQFFAKKRD